MPFQRSPSCYSGKKRESRPARILLRGSLSRSTRNRARLGRSTRLDRGTGWAGDLRDHVSITPRAHTLGEDQHNRIVAIVANGSRETTPTVGA